MSQRYRRTGQVTATRLVSDRRWQIETQRGTDATMISRAGDWWVTSPDGGERGVTAGEFHKLYERDDADPEGVYRRRGEVNARRATTPGSVRTLEGEASYRTGDWLVSDDRGNTWPVPDDVFRASYELLR